MNITLTITLLFLLLLNSTNSLHTTLVKRAPLEIGYVTTLSDVNNLHGQEGRHQFLVHTQPVVAPSVSGLKDVTATPAAFLLAKAEPVELATVLVTSNKIFEHGELKKTQITHHPTPVHHRVVVWLPGRVYHHAFIPPHLQVHLHLVGAAPTTASVIVHHRHYGHHGGNILAEHYGGYGAGIDGGGPGAGHGFQAALFNTFD